MESKSAIWLARSYGLERYKGRSSRPDHGRGKSTSKNWSNGPEKLPGPR
jgi:hypothetical protein